VASLTYKDIKLASTIDKDEIDMPATDAAFDPDRRVELDRRMVNNERRGDYDPGYHGPVRRNTIDRRLKPKDRRK
jgi:hypothetical protein